MGPNLGRFVGGLARLLLPQATAQAACPESWYEYYTTACGDLHPAEVPQAAILSVVQWQDHLRALEDMALHLVTGSPTRTSWAAQTRARPRR